LCEEFRFLGRGLRVKNKIDKKFLPLQGILQGGKMEQQLIVSADSLVDALFKFLESPTRSEHRKFFKDMICGILGNKSPLLSNISRFLNEDRPLIQTEQRLSRLLRSRALPWESLMTRLTELGSFRVRNDDVIAFDPGDVVKPYAEKMENLYRVRDGSEDVCGNGYEEFGAEVVQWVDGKKFHIPLYSKLTNASRADYIGQNFQIIQAIRTMHDYLGNRGIWTFDRGHDRSCIFNRGLFLLDMRWIIRAKENRSVEPEDSTYRLPNKYYPGVFDIVKQMKLSETPLRLTFPKITGQIYLGWTRIKIIGDPRENRWLTLVVAHDRRNQDPVVLITSEAVDSNEKAMVIFGNYLCRWSKEEGYRFTGSYLKLETLRTMSFDSISRLAWMVHLTYFFVTAFYRGSPEKIEKQIDQRLRSFQPCEDIEYKYYRVADLMRVLMCEQRTMPFSSLMSTQVA
jgi:hypothetical protein